MHNSSQQLQNFVGILQRASTFQNLIFYNKRLVDPYLLAAYGFHKIQSKDDIQQVKCYSCRASFKLDSLAPDAIHEVKQPLSYILKAHQEECPISSQKGKSLELNMLSIAENGPELFSRILESYNESDMGVDFNYESFLEGESKNTKKQVQIFLEKQGKGKPASHLFLSLFGWKAKTDKTKMLECQYCGKIERVPSEGFHFIDSHGSTCLLIDKKMWRVILQKLTIYSLQNVEGEFLKTKGLVRAKEIRGQLEQILQKSVFSLQKFCEDVERIKNSIQEAHDRIQTAGAQNEERKRQNSTTLDQIKKLAKQIDESLTGSINEVRL